MTLIHDSFDSVNVSESNNLTTATGTRQYPRGDLEEYLNSGWELVQIYPRGDKAVVRLP